MQSEIVFLGDIVTHQKGFAFKSIDYVDSGVPVVRVSNFTNDSISTTDLKYVTETVSLLNQSVSLSELDVVISTVGSWPNNPASIVGKTVLVPKQLDGALLNQNSVRLRVKSTSSIDQEFLFYSLKSKNFSDYLISTAQGSANQASITLKDIFSYEIQWFNKTYRAKVVSIIGSISRKITLNRQINQTLEAMAQALFKSWFVDFEPVKAKMAALASGGNDEDTNHAAMSAISGKTTEQVLALKTDNPAQYQQLYDTAVLFPSEMVESELGEIPLGWEVKSLKTQCELNRTSWTTKTLPNSVKYVDLASAKDGVISDIQTFFETEIPSRAKRILNVGDTIIGTVRPANRSFGLVEDKNLTGSTGFAVLTPRFEYLKEFVYLLSTSDDNIERLARLADGGAYPAVRPEQVVDVDVVIPDDFVMQLFHSKTQFIFDLIALNRKESQHLTSLRDTLLPKLLSGELSVDGVGDNV